MSGNAEKIRKSQRRRAAWLGAFRKMTRGLTVKAVNPLLNG